MYSSLNALLDQRSENKKPSKLLNKISTNFTKTIIRKKRKELLKPVVKLKNSWPPEKILALVEQVGNE